MLEGEAVVDSKGADETAEQDDCINSESEDQPWNGRRIYQKLDASRKGAGMPASPLPATVV